MSAEEGGGAGSSLPRQGLAEGTVTNTILEKSWADWGSRLWSSEDALDPSWASRASPRAAAAPSLKVLWSWEEGKGGGRVRPSARSGAVSNQAGDPEASCLCSQLGTTGCL